MVQVDDYLYAGTPSLYAGFESFLQTKFCIAALKANEFHIMGARLFQDHTDPINIKAREKLLNIHPILLDHSSNGD